MAPGQIIRLECLKLALAVPGAERGGAPVAVLAAQFEIFVQGVDNPAAAGPAPAPEGKPQNKGAPAGTRR